MGFSRARNRNLSPSELDLLPKQSARRCSLETTLYATATRAGRRSGPGFRRTKGCFTRSRAQCIRCSEIHGGFRAGSYPKSNIEFRRYGFFVIEILRSCNHNHFPFSFPMAGTALHASHCHVLTSHFAYRNGTEARSRARHWQQKLSRWSGQQAREMRMSVHPSVTRSKNSRTEEPPTRRPLLRFAQKRGQRILLTS